MLDSISSDREMKQKSLEKILGSISSHSGERKKKRRKKVSDDDDTRSSKRRSRNEKRLKKYSGLFSDFRIISLRLLLCWKSLPAKLPPYKRETLPSRQAKLFHRKLRLDFFFYFFFFFLFFFTFVFTFFHSFFTLFFILFSWLTNLRWACGLRHVTVFHCQD